MEVSLRHAGRRQGRRPHQRQRPGHSAPASGSKIFGRFVRLGSELERDKPGTGLGLYIVRTLVTRLGGKIRISRPRARQAGNDVRGALAGTRACTSATVEPAPDAAYRAAATAPARPANRSCSAVFGPPRVR